MNQRLRSHAALDELSRNAKAKRIIDHLGITAKKNLKILDVGTGSGYIPSEIGKIHTVTSVDVNDERVAKADYHFKKITSEQLPFPDGSFDVVISNQVVEHIPKQAEHIAEICRVLKPGGSLYVATPNRAWIMDPHTRLIGVNWLPRRIADYYTRVAKKGAWDVFPVTYGWLQKSIQKSNVKIEKNSYDILVSIDNDASVKKHFKIMRKVIPDFILRKTDWAYPSIVFVGRKI